MKLSEAEQVLKQPGMVRMKQDEYQKYCGD